MQLVAGLVALCLAVVSPLWAARVVLNGIVALLVQRQSDTQNL